MERQAALRIFVSCYLLDYAVDAVLFWLRHLASKMNTGPAY